MSTLKRIAAALEEIAAILRTGVVNVKDVDRAKVYSQHLGEKLRPTTEPVPPEAP